MDEVHEWPRWGDGNGEIVVGNGVEGNGMEVGIKQITPLQSLDSAQAAYETVKGCC